MATLTIKGHEVLVDDSDLKLVSAYKWWLRDKGNGRLVVVSRANLTMHRLLMNAQPGQMVDHANRNPLDNRRANLRFCTVSQNQQNRHYNKGSSLFKGVYREGSKWRAYIGFESKQIWLGSFTNEEDAARMHDKAARIYHGEFAFLNFPVKETLNAQGR
jgi:hypothetical protein